MTNCFHNACDISDFGHIFNDECPKYYESDDNFADSISVYQIEKNSDKQSETFRVKAFQTTHGGDCESGTIAESRQQRHDVRKY